MPADSKLSSMVMALVEGSRRHAALVATLALLAATGIGLGAYRHLGIDTDTTKLISPDLPWRRAGAEVERDFPQNNDLIAVVVDGVTPDQAGDAAAALADQLAAEPTLFQEVRQPDGSRFFRENGLLFLPRTDVQAFADGMISAQPMLGTLAADPSTRGVFDALDLFAQGAIHGEIAPAVLNRPFAAVDQALETALAGGYAPLSWQNLLSDRPPLPRELRRFVLARPALNFGAVEPGRRAIDAVHAAARAAGFIAPRGVTVRVTGPVALSDDQLAALKEGAGLAAALAIGLLVFWLGLAVRSVRTAAAILVTLATGLVGCVGFAVAAVGPFNPISVAFAPLFIGIAIDFGIQFSVRYAAERQCGDGAAAAFRRTSAGVGAPLIVAGAATAVGFLSLYPTDYRGVSELGLIAGAGMLIALGLNLTLLPALLVVFRAGGFREAQGFSWGAPLDRFLVRRRRIVIAAAGVAAVAAAAALAGLRFDFDPINLENPKSESVRTLFDLMKSPDTTPYTLDVLAPSAPAAADLAQALGRLPDVSQAVWLGSFVPEDQAAKLDILADARELLAPTLSPATVKPSPSDREVLAAAARCAADVGRVAGRAAGRLAAAIRRGVADGPAILPAFQAGLAAGAARRIADLRLALRAGPVSLATIPADVRRDWVGLDGRFRIQVFPRGDARDPTVLRRFVAAVRRLAPGATGMPVDIQESANTVIGAFRTAGVLAILAITALLGALLRRARDVAMVLSPLVLAGLLTLGTGVLLGLPLNFANIVTLPLLLGIGVAFDIYFVLRWRAGEAGLLRSPTARGVIFSALTTGTAFGSLALSNSPGMAEMGKLLSLGLFYTLAATVFFLPALLGPPPEPASRPAS